MKLLTHNMLTSKVLKNVVTGYPLKIEATKVEVKKADFQPDFVARMLKKVDYKVLYDAAQTVLRDFITKTNTLICLDQLFN
jgi:multifunctional methyltransferase subunit TRM112